MSLSTTAEIKSTELTGLPTQVQATDQEQNVKSKSVPFTRSWLKWPQRVIVSLWRTFTLLLFLATLAAIPLVNVMVLGFFLELQGRYIRTGTFASSRRLCQIGSQFGALMFGTLLCLLPIHFMTSLAYEAQLINPNGEQVQVILFISHVMATCIAVHLMMVWMRGGHWSFFVRPFQNFRWMREQLRHRNLLKASTDIWFELWKQPAFAVQSTTNNSTTVPERSDVEPNANELASKPISLLPLPVYLFWLGLRGLILSVLWLFVPILFFAAASSSEELTAALRLFGAALMVPVLCWLPFLQAQFATENRLKAGFNWRKARTSFNSAPLRSVLSIFLLYGLSIPLFLMKIIVIPQDTVWMMSLFFVLLMLPARICLAYTLSRTEQRDQTTHFLWRSGWRLLGIGLVMIYIFILFFTPYIGAHGTDILFEQPALMLPTPF